MIARSNALRRVVHCGHLFYDLCWWRRTVVGVIAGKLEMHPQLRWFLRKLRCTKKQSSTIKFRPTNSVLSGKKLRPLVFTDGRKLMSARRPMRIFWSFLAPCPGIFWTCVGPILKDGKPFHAHFSAFLPTFRIFFWTFPGPFWIFWPFSALCALNSSMVLLNYSDFLFIDFVGVCLFHLFYQHFGLF